MAYWCDDQRLNLEQRRLDEAQADAAARLNAELRRRAVARLSPMERSVRISRLRDEMELHPERERECLAQIEELEDAAHA